MAFPALRAVVPTARRIVAAHWEHSARTPTGLAPAMAKGKFDAFLLMPRGPRDEEFHTAISSTLRLGVDRGRSGGRALRWSPRPGRDPHPRSVTTWTGWACPAGATPRRDVGREIRRFDGAPSPLRPALRGARVAPPRSATSPCRSTAARRHRRRDRRRPGHRRGRPGRSRRLGLRRLEGLATVVIEAEAVGGQAGTSSMIRNYLGFPRGISGCAWPNGPATRPSASAPASSPAGRSPRSSPGPASDRTWLRTEGGDVRPARW